MFLGKVTGNLGGQGRSTLGFVVIAGTLVGRAKVSGGAVQKGRWKGPKGQHHLELVSQKGRWLHPEVILEIILPCRAPGLEVCNSLHYSKWLVKIVIFLIFIHNRLPGNWQLFTIWDIERTGQERPMYRRKCTSRRLEQQTTISYICSACCLVFFYFLDTSDGYVMQDG